MQAGCTQDYFCNVQNGRSWTAFTYAGELSTAAWGFNDAGVSFTLNAVYANEVKTGGVGRTFVSRSLLDAPDLESAVERAQEANQATGHNLNIIGLDEHAIVTVETGLPLECLPSLTWSIHGLGSKSC